MVVKDAFRPDLPPYKNLGRTGDERRWLAELPDLVSELERRWGVSTGPPFRDGTSAWTAPGLTHDGRRVVLKVAWPHREARGESAALRVWSGEGAVLVYAAEPGRYALLMERCEPGTRLDQSGLGTEDILLVAGDLLARLWAAPPPFPDDIEEVGDVTREWADLVRRRMEELRPPFDPWLVEAGASLLVDLPSTATRSVVVHGDFNPGNILAAQRQPWLVVDAKPMVGDPGYDPWPLLAQVDPPFNTPGQESVLKGRSELFGDIADEPPQRLLAWAVARSVESALWNVSRGDLEAGTDDMAEAAVFARVAGL